MSSAIAAAVAVTVVQGKLSSNAANKAAKAQAAANERGIEITAEAARSAKESVNQFFPQARQFITEGTQQAIQAIQQPGELIGSFGAERQRQALSEFAISPGQQFLQQEAERSLLRNQAAIGGLGGGNVRRALQRQAIGLAGQNLQGTISNQLAFGAATGAIQQGRGTNLANIAQQQGIALANIGTGSATQLAGLQQQGGAVQAAGILGQNAALQGGLGQLSNLAGQFINTPAPVVASTPVQFSNPNPAGGALGVNTTVPALPAGF